MSDYTIRDYGAARGTEIDLDDGAGSGSYHLDLEATSWGNAAQVEPEEEQSQDGPVLWLPTENAWRRREIRLAGFLECVSLFDKDAKRSTLTRLFQGRKVLRRYGWEIEVFGMAPVEQGDTRRAWQLLGYEVALYATPPFWRMAIALNAIGYGDALLYPDMGIPAGEAQPPYLFGRDLGGAQAITASPGTGAHLTITNWGAAPANPAASITAGPLSTTLYLRGSGPYRVAVSTNGSGAATLTEAQKFYLAPGANALRLENAAGTALDLTGYATMRIDFGATIFRFL